MSHKRVINLLLSSTVCLFHHPWKAPYGRTQLKFVGLLRTYSVQGVLYMYIVLYICHNQSCLSSDWQLLFFSLQMHCKFIIYNVPWEKRKELLNHECVGLKEERMLSCERSEPAVNTSEPADEDNFVTEFAEEVQLWLACNWVSLF